MNWSADLVSDNIRAIKARFCDTLKANGITESAAVVSKVYKVAPIAGWTGRVVIPTAPIREWPVAWPTSRPASRCH